MQSTVSEEQCEHNLPTALTGGESEGTPSRLPTKSSRKRDDVGALARVMYRIFLRLVISYYVCRVYAMHTIEAKGACG